MGEQRGLAPLLTVDLAPVTVELNLRESGARFPCKWSSVLEIYTIKACPAVRIYDRYSSVIRYRLMPKALLRSTISAGILGRYFLLKLVSPK